MELVPGKPIIGLGHFWNGDRTGRWGEIIRSRVGVKNCFRCGAERSELFRSEVFLKNENPGVKYYPGISLEERAADESIWAFPDLNFWNLSWVKGIESCKIGNNKLEPCINTPWSKQYIVIEERMDQPVEEAVVKDQKSVEDIKLKSVRASCLKLWSCCILLNVLPLK